MVIFTDELDLLNNYLVHQNYPLKLITRLPLIIFISLMICGCFGGAEKPTVHDINPEEYDASRMNNIVLSRKVVLESGKEKKGFFLSEKTVDVTATSNFGKENDIANIDCIVAGLRNVLQDPVIIPPTKFWETVGKNKDTLNLTSLFDERYSHVVKILEIDYMVVAYHQLFDEESVFMEWYAAGLIGDKNRDNAAAVTIDMKNKLVIDAIDVDAENVKAVGHTVFIIPFAIIRYPEESPCQLAGRHAAEAISRSLTTNKEPRIVVVAAQMNPYFVLSVPTHVSYKTLELNKEIKAYCQSADSGQADAQKHIGDLYYLGIHGIKRDLILAYVWYSLAAMGENKEVTKQLQSLVDELSPHQVDEAVRKLLDWKPGQCERDLNNAISEGNE